MEENKQTHEVLFIYSGILFFGVLFLMAVYLIDRF